MKYSIRYVLRDKNAAGLHPIYLRIIIGRKKSDTATGHKIAFKFWDPVNEKIKSTHELATEINADLLIRKQNILKEVVGLQMDQKVSSAKQLKQSVVGKIRTTNIFEFVEKFKDDMKFKRATGTLKNYTSHLLKLETFNGSKNLSFEEIDHDFLLRYENYLKSEPFKHSENYIHSLWKTYKTFFNEAKKRGVINCYPFDNYENPNYISPTKDYLTLDEIKKWEDNINVITSPQIKQAAVYFLLGCYAGFRIGDWFLFDIDKNVTGNKIKLRADKNGTWVEMIISKPLQRNLERMKTIKLTSEEPTINKNLKTIARQCKINKRVSTHTGRHSFAVSVCLGNGLSSETTAKLMGITLPVFVANYSQVTQNKIDKETLTAWSNL
jgi:site-specific recombinase XerD